MTSETPAGAAEPDRTAAASVSTHILDTSAGRPARGITVELSVRTGTGAAWSLLGTSRTGDDGRCQDLPPLPPGTTHAQLSFAVGGAFFPEVTTAFAVEPGEHYHVPLLFNPFGYSVYRGS